MAITGNYVPGEDILAFANQLGIIGGFNAATGKLTLTGVASVANYQTALRAVTYFNTSDNPSIAPRTVTIRAGDGKELSAVKTRTINVSTVNDPPVNVVPSSQSLVKNGTRVFGAVAGNQISFSDVDHGGANEQLTLTVSNGTVTLATLAGLSGSGNGTNSLTYTGTVAALNAALDGMLFTPTLNFTGTASITLNTNDLGATGSGGAQSDNDVVNISMINPAPLAINEVMWNPPENNKNQYIELRNTTGAAAAIPAGYYLVGIEGHAAFNTGEVHDIFNLSGAFMSTGSNGVLTILQSSNLYSVNGLVDPAGMAFTQNPIAPSFGNNAAGITSTVGHSASQRFVELENANSSTLFLVYAATPPQIGDDIDSNNDGLPDGSVFNNWAIVDSVGRGNELTTGTDYVYGQINFIDPTGTTTAVTGPSSLVSTTVETNFTPSWVGRTGNTTGSTSNDWLAADLEGDNPFWEVGSLKSSLPGFAGLALDHINAPNFPGILAKPVADLNGPLDGRDSLASFISTDPAINVFSSAAAVTDVDSAKPDPDRGDHYQPVGRRQRDAGGQYGRHKHRRRLRGWRPDAQRQRYPRALSTGPALRHV